MNKCKMLARQSSDKYKMKMASKKVNFEMLERICLEKIREEQMLEEILNYQYNKYKKLKFLWVNFGLFLWKINFARTTRANSSLLA